MFLQQELKRLRKDVGQERIEEATKSKEECEFLKYQLQKY